MYSRERVEAVARETAIPSATRLLRNTAKHALDMRASPSRFCDGRSYAVLYGAVDFDTCFIEVVVRDRFVGKNDRTVPYGELTTRAWVEFSSRVPLRLIDLQLDGAIRLGAPTDAAKARNQAAGRALSKSIHDGHPDIDGFMYESRLTGMTCYAIFERAVGKLIELDSGHLEEHPQLPTVLSLHRIGLQRS